MERIQLISRMLLGAIFLVMGLNGFFELLSISSSTVEGKEFIDTLASMKYFWPFEKLLELLSGVFLLSNRFVVLAVELLAPIICNILLFHLLLDPSGLALAFVILILEIILIIKFWKTHYCHLFIKNEQE